MNWRYLSLCYGGKDAGINGFPYPLPAAPLMKKTAGSVMGNSLLSIDSKYLKFNG